MELQDFCKIARERNGFSRERKWVFRIFQRERGGEN